MKNIFYLLLLPSFLFYGCKKEEVPFNGPGSVSGTVFEYGTTVPVSGAWVYLITRSYDSYPNVTKVIKAVQTDTTGSFTINYDWETGISYEVFVKYTGTAKIYGDPIPKYIDVSKKTQNRVNFGLTIRSYFTFNMIKTGNNGNLDYFDIIGNFKVRNITKDTFFISYSTAYIPTIFNYKYQYAGSDKILDYTPRPSPFFGTKGDTLHYTVYF